MRLELEPHVPYDESVLWRIHDAYYAACGRGAWDEGDIPSYATSNYGRARQHAALVVELVAELVRGGKLGPRERLHVLEIGSGSGAFAANFLRALDRGLGDDGRRVLKRLRYVLSDYSARSAREALTGRALAPWADRGVVVPATFDLRAPEAPRALDGKKLRGPFTAVLANYVACVSPHKIVRRTKDGWFERHTSVAANVPAAAARRSGTAQALLKELLKDPTKRGLFERVTVGHEWRRAELARLFADPVHARVLEGTVGSAPEATLPYPFRFVELLRELAPLLVPGGLALVSDYGGSDTNHMRARDDRDAQQYGNALAHGVAFPIFDAAADALGLSVVRTASTRSSVHTAAIRYRRRMPRSFEEAFRRTHEECTDGEDLVAFGEAARLRQKAKEYSTAAMLYRRCLAIDEENPELHYRAAHSLADAGEHEEALGHLARGEALDPEKRLDFQFLRGRVLFELGRYGEAIASYMLSIVREYHPATFVNLGVAREAAGDPESAIEAYDAALLLEPGNAKAKARIAAIRRKLSRG